MLRKIIVLTAVAALASACDHKKDKAAPKPIAKPGTSSPEAAKLTGPVGGTADGVISVDGEKKKFEIRPEKSPLLNSCSIIKVQTPAGLEQHMNVSFSGEVEGKKSKIYFQIKDAKSVDTLAAYLAEIQSDGYASTKAPLKISLDSDKTTVSVTDLVGLSSASTTMSCNLEVIPSLVNNNAAWNDVRGQEQTFDNVINGAQLVFSCNDSSGAYKLSGVEFAGYCAVSL